MRCANGAERKGRRAERGARGAAAAGAGARRAVLAGWAGLLAAAATVGPADAGAQETERAPVVVGAAEFVLPLARHRGYRALRWTDIPPGLLEGREVEGLEASARAAGADLRLTAGSPFLRHGDALYQLANEPYLRAGELWVPTELLTRWLPAVGGAPAASASAGTVSRRAGPWRVVIDPGHGGHDPGTVNRRTGAREKDIVLAVGRRLAEALRRRSGIEPILTRDEDRFIRLQDRPRLAIARDADLFVSIHVNSVPGRVVSANGFETYYLSQARTEESRRVAVRENSVVELEEAGDRPNLDQLEFILAGLDRDGNVDESRRLAGYLQNGLRRVSDGRDRGVKPGPFWVLVGATATMPAVLVELGFITNPEDERNLKTPAAQARMAEALADQISAYFAEKERRLATLEGRD